MGNSAPFPAPCLQDREILLLHVSFSIHLRLGTAASLTMFSSIFDFFTSLRTVHTYGPLSESGSDIPGSELEAVEQLLAQKWVDGGSFFTTGSAKSPSDPLYKGWDASVSVNGRTTTCLEAYLGIMAETASKSGCVVTVKSLFGDMLAAGLIMTPKGIRDM